MCLAAVAIDAHPDFPFICLANRDEFHDRPTAPLHAWELEAGTLYAGKDLLSGGTWLGVGSNAEFALLTNVRNSTLNMPGAAPSRGALVVNAIQNVRGPSEAESVHYAGFNLIHGNLGLLALRCTSNQGLRLNNDFPFSSALRQGIHTLSNGHLDAPWPKSRRLKEGLLGEIEKSISSPVELQKFEQSLLKLLDHTGLADDAELPSTGVPYEWEKMLSAVKIISPLYGTRSSAIMLLDSHHTVHFTEITFDTAGNETGRQRFEIPLPPNLPYTS
ncbi:NRDE family protein [Limnobacter sp.]|uniref:NRDE family protein n=1 Tax=Limnobacter sp. TaxID=2003368 RepID=UPI002734DED0|nr:NRDE family protein [Limnobacter sp.]MDP3189518.1 NRDE family protein [Limnobacter sp.]